MKKLYKLLSKGIIAGLGFTLLSLQAQAQAPTISYPTAAESITRAGASSKHTVKLVFNATCSGTVRLGFAESVRYIASSVNKTGGTVGVTIAESDISNLARPVFSITGVGAIGDEITFPLTA